MESTTTCVCDNVICKRLAQILKKAGRVSYFHKTTSSERQREWYHSGIISAGKLAKFISPKLGGNQFVARYHFEEKFIKFSTGMLVKCEGKWPIPRCMQQLQQTDGDAYQTLVAELLTTHKWSVVAPVVDSDNNVKSKVTPVASTRKRKDGPTDSGTFTGGAGHITSRRRESIKVSEGGSSPIRSLKFGSETESFIAPSNLVNTKTYCICGTQQCLDRVGSATFAGYRNLPSDKGSREAILVGLKFPAERIEMIHRSIQQRQLEAQLMGKYYSINYKVAAHHFNKEAEIRSVHEMIFSPSHPDSNSSASNSRQHLSAEARGKAQRKAIITAGGTSANDLHEEILLSKALSELELKESKRQLDLVLKQLEEAIHNKATVRPYLRYTDVSCWNDDKIKEFFGIPNGSKQLQSLFDVCNHEEVARNLMRFDVKNKKDKGYNSSTPEASTSSESEPPGSSESTASEIGRKAANERWRRAREGNDILSAEDEYIFTLFVLRSGVTKSMASTFFGIHESTGEKLFTKWIRHLRVILDLVFEFPSAEMLSATYPDKFKCRYPHSFISQVWDATELILQVSQNSTSQYVTWSQYKHRNTGKLLVSISASGCFLWSSAAYGGRITDDVLVKESGVLSSVKPGEGIMADKGFRDNKILNDIGATYFTPPVKLRNKSFNLDDVLNTEGVANLRIHVERLMRRTKEFKILDGSFPITMCDLMGDIFFVCSMLGNLQPSLVGLDFYDEY